MSAVPLDDWIGRTQTTHDTVTSAPVAALTATLDNGNASPLAGEALPPLWHWLYFLPHPMRSELGPDGHAAKGGFLPPVPLPRRMWAGSRIAWHDALRVGDDVVRVSRVDDVTRKSGKSGELVFVQVTHTVSTVRGVALTERTTSSIATCRPRGRSRRRPRGPAPTRRGRSASCRTTYCCSATRR